MSKQLQKKCTAFIILLMVFSASIQAQWLTSGTNIYNTNTGKVGIGTSTTTVPSGMLTVKGAGSVPASSWVAAGAPLFTGFGETAVGNADYILAMASTSNNGRPVFVGRRSRGTLALPTVLANNDFIMSMLASGYDGTAFQNPSTIDFYVDGTPSAGNVPTRISFVTGSNSGNRAERLKIGSTGNIAFNNTQMYLNNATGNVGIGTNTPTAQLHLGNIVTNRKLVLFDIVNDNNQFYGFGVNSGVLRYQVDAPSSSHVFYAAYPAPTTGSNELMRIQGTGNVGIGTSNPGARLEVAGQVKITGGFPGAGKVLTSDTAGLAFWGDLPVTSSSQWVSSGSNIYNNNAGNVGIGNANPARAKLEVNGVAGTGSTSAIFGGEGTGISIQRNWPTIGFNQYRDEATGYGKAIGNGFGMQMHLDPNTGAYSINMQDSVAANTAFALPVKGITVFKNGFVHVGNNNISDVASLSISGSSNFPSHFNFGTEGHTWIRGGNKIFGGFGVFANRRPSKVYINDQPGEQFGTGAYAPGGDVILVGGGGNIGVGIDNPDYKMLIYSGTPESASNNTQIFKLRGRNPIQVFSDEFNTDRGYIKGVTNRSQTSQFSREGIEIGTGGGDIYLTAAGYQPALMVNGTTNYVGLGTNNPAYRLDVCGAIRGKEVRVETGWCDYVFADDYKLRSLSEVEQFIKTNKHLPEVTAGDIIEKEGLEVGKTAAQMIKKIEELTLYVIEQEKALKTLQEQNAKMESAINSLILKGGK